MTSSPTPRVLAFSDRKAERCPVSTPHGIVALMDTGSWSSGFQVVDPAGGVLCTGGVALGSFGRRWEVTDAAGSALLRLTGWGRSTTLRFADGRTCAVRGRLFTRTWTMTDAAGAEVLRSVPVDSGPAGFHPNSWVVEQDGSLSLLQFIAAVQTHRRADARRRTVGNALPF